jgi:hypothetical protein
MSKDQFVTAIKARLAKIRQAEADLKAKLSEPSSQNPKGGRPKKKDSKEEIAKSVGVSRTAIREIEKHVSLAEQYPFLQRAFPGVLGIVHGPDR